MEQAERPAPPESLKPWYYQDWFLFPMLVFWPLWPVLMLRSPWHNGLVSGAIAWAALFCGGYLVLWEQLYKTHTLNQLTLTIITPGLIFTVITQVHWFQRRRLVRAATREATPSATPPLDPNPSRRTRRSRRRRASRHPR